MTTIEQVVLTLNPIHPTLPFELVESFRSLQKICESEYIYMSRVSVGAKLESPRQSIPGVAWSILR